MMKSRALLVEDDSVWAKDFLGNLQTPHAENLLGPGIPGLEVVHVTNQQDADKAVGTADSRQFDIVLLDLCYPLVPGGPLGSTEEDKYQGLNWLEDLRRLLPNATVVVITSHPYDNELRDVVEAVRKGKVNDFIPKTSPFDHIATRIGMAFRNQQQVSRLHAVEDELHHVLFQTRSVAVLNDSVSRLIERCTAQLVRTSHAVESGDPTAIRRAPGEIQTQCRHLGEEYRKLADVFPPIGPQDPEPTDLAEIASDMLLFYSRQIDGTGARADVVGPAKPVTISTYSPDVKIALNEILRNAVKALKKSRTPSERKTLDVEVTANPELSSATIRVTDNGDGFPDAILDDPFRAPVSSGKEGHCGIGLYIARHMIQAIGGSVTVRNRPAGGAEVTLTIPNLAAK